MYLEGRGYLVSSAPINLRKQIMSHRVPKGSILGPLMVNLYMLSLGQLLCEHHVTYHSYADNTQIYLALSPNDFGTIDSLCLCLEKVNGWMQQNSAKECYVWEQIRKGFYLEFRAINYNSCRKYYI